MTTFHQSASLPNPYHKISSRSRVANIVTVPLQKMMSIFEWPWQAEEMSESTRKH